MMRRCFTGLDPMPNPITLHILGVPKPGGSKRGFIVKGRVNIVDDCKTNKEWRQAVVIQARNQYDGPTLTGALRVEVTFYMPRPKYHYRTGKRAGELKPNAPKWHTKKPDRTKLLRSTEDALTDAGIWRDDAQLCDGPIRKVYTDDGRPGAVIRIEVLEDAA